MTDSDKGEDATMSGFEGTDACATVRDVLPLRGTYAWEGDWTAPVGEHLARCEACRAEAAFVDHLRSARPEPPAGFPEAVVRAFADGARGEAEPHSLPSWRRLTPAGLSAAAVAVLALGFGFLWERDPASDRLWELALEPDAPSWYGDEWLVAGGAVPEALSDDVLLRLVEEMEP